MRRIFLFFTCIILFLFLKHFQDSRKYEIKRLDVNYSELVDFTGKVHLPLTLHWDEEQVKENVAGIIEISIAGKKYTYKQKMVSYTKMYQLEKNSPVLIYVYKGDWIRLNFDKSNLKNWQTVKLFAEKEIQ